MCGSVNCVASLYVLSCSEVCCIWMVSLDLKRVSRTTQCTQLKGMYLLFKLPNNMHELLTDAMQAAKLHAEYDLCHVFTHTARPNCVKDTKRQKKTEPTKSVPGAIDGMIYMLVGPSTFLVFLTETHTHILR